MINECSNKTVYQSKSEVFYVPSTITVAKMENSTLSTLTRNVVQQITFSWYDYILFTAMLALSALIGIYYGCFGSKQSTPNEYLMGDNRMKVIPISISLVASHISAIALLAIPADVYRFGANYWLIVPSLVVVSFITVYVYLPVFYKLKITSTYEYLERRFDSRMRSLASFLFALSLFLYLPVVIYIPALGFSAATGINVHYITPIVCGVCIFYTTLGGLKAVIWTDTIQFVVTLVAVFTVFVLGLRSAGGFGAVFSKAKAGNRLDLFDFSLDPTLRETFWIDIIGCIFGGIHAFSVHQSCVQKFLSVPTLADAKRCVYYFGFGFSIVMSFSIFTGLIMYAKYENCDPVTSGAIRRNDQLLPYYVMDVASHIPGLSGLFIAGIFSSALSTLSASLNCLAGTFYEDFVKKITGSMSEDRATYTLKLLVVVIGVVCTLLVYVIEMLGEIMPMVISLAGVTSGPLVGMFTLGVLCPRASSKGVFYGSVTSMVTVGFIILMAQYYKMQGLLSWPSRPLSTEGCPNLATFTSVIESITTTALPTLIKKVVKKEKAVPFFLFRLSYLYYTPIGVMVTILVAVAVSYYCQNDDPPVHKDLLSPVIYPYLADSDVVDQKVSYCSVEKGLNLVESNSEEE